MKQAEASDFEVKVLEGGVNVTFKPTFSYYRLIRPFDMIERLGPISSSATVRHMAPVGISELGFWSWRFSFRGGSQRFFLVRVITLSIGGFCLIAARTCAAQLSSTARFSAAQS